MGLQRVADASSELGAWDGRSPVVPFSGVLLFRAHLNCLKEQCQGMEARSMPVTRMAKMSGSQVARPSPMLPSAELLTNALSPSEFPLRGATEDPAQRPPSSPQTVPTAVWI